MKEKMRVAFIYNRTDPFYSGTHVDNTLYHFYFDALKRSPELEVSFFPYIGTFDASNLKGLFDAVLVAENPLAIPAAIKGIEKLGIPVVDRVGDPHYKVQDNLHDFRPSFCFGFFPASYFYKYFSANIKYQMIVHGLEPSLYQNVIPFNQRIKKRILNSGATASKTSLGRILERIRYRKTYPWQFYKLRTMCNKLPYIDYTRPLNHEYVGDRYPQLLTQYCGAIAATTTNPNIKYWEIPAAGCLTFMEITEKNDGKVLGYEDGETAIFINEKNYKCKFDEYLSDPNDPKWERIASAGRQYAHEKFNNDRAVHQLTLLIRDLA